MKKFAIVLLAASIGFGVASLLLFSTSRVQLPSANEQLRVAASFYPLANFAAAVGGEYADVTNIVPPGTEPHDFEPTAKNIAAIYSADVFLLNGAGFDPWAKKIIPEAEKNGVAVFTAAGYVDLAPNAEVNELDEHTCLHIEHGPFRSVAAVHAPAPLPDVSRIHTRFDITLAEKRGDSRGTVSFEATESSEYAFYVTEKIPVTLLAPDGKIIPFEASQAVVKDCPAAKVKHVADLDTGIYRLSFGEAPVGTVGIAIENALAKEDEEGHDHAHGAWDPHIWLDPVLAAQIVEAIRDRFIAADPTHAAAYRANAAAYTQELEALDAEYRSGLAVCRIRDAVASHAAFRYLAARYNLMILPIAGISPDDEPSPRAMAEIATIAKEKGITHIFFETLLSPKLAETIAREIGAQTLVFNPIEGLTHEEAARGETYLSLMRTNLANLRTALACQ